MAKDLFELATSLVRDRITGHRKGLPDAPNFQHSFDVAETLQAHNFSNEVILAGLLHDIYEDGNTTFEELRQFGFPERVIDLVRLCSFDKSIVDNNARWFMMIIGLYDASDADAWAIKIADLIDNLRDSWALPAARADFMRHAKAPILLRLTYPQLGSTELWQELKEETEK
jgi:(p)ppGpp synthase/HD superfamily hydrolase